MFMKRRKGQRMFSSSDIDNASHLNQFVHIFMNKHKDHPNKTKNHKSWMPSLIMSILTNF